MRKRHKRVNPGVSLQSASHGKLPGRGWHLMEMLETRVLLSGSNALDQLNFGNLASEAAHQFEPGYAVNNMPLAGVGVLGQTYREPVGTGSSSPTGSQVLTFTMAVDPNRQNYLTIKLWGSDIPGGQMYLLNAPSSYDAIEQSGGNPILPNRFYTETFPIPLAWTQGRASTPITLSFVASFDRYGGTGTHYLSQGQLTEPIYSVYSHTDPYFIPDPTDPVGSKPAQSATPTLSTLSAAQVLGTTTSPGILLSNRQSLFGSNGYINQVLARQVMPGTTGAPPETIGLDLFTNASSWASSNPGASADTWRNRIANTKAGPGYTAFPDELLSVLTTAFITQPFTDANGNTVAGLDRYHDSTLIPRIIAALDGASYQQDSDGGFIQQGSEWTGLTSTPRTTGSFIGSTARQSTVHGGGDLQGIDTQTLGWTILQLLNDPVGGPAFQTYLGQSYDADLSGGSMPRASAYERMLYNAINWYSQGTGGTESQNMFQMVAMYAASVALQKLQALYPNPAYVVNPANYPSGNWLQSTYTPLQAAKMVMGLIPDTLRGVNKGSSYTNYGMSHAGLGEAGGVLDGGQDGGGYGEMLPWIAPRIAQYAQYDSTISTADLASFQAVARSTINAYDQFIYPQENATINSSGQVTSDIPTMATESFITYRNVENPNWNADTYNFDAQYPASDPAGGVNSAYALRAAYLGTQYGLGVGTGASVGSSGAKNFSSLNYLRDLSAYESTLRSLINVNPNTLTPLPGEPGQGNYAWADVQIGAVAFDNNGERFFMNANWRNGTFNGGNFTQTGNIARIDDITDTTDHAAWIVMPHDSYTVQSDGNLTGTYNQPWIVRYGNYLIVLNQSQSAYNAALPQGVGLAQDLVTHNLYNLGSSVSVPGGHYAIFWLNASSIIPAVGPGQDVGSVGTAGSDSYAGGIYTVSGAGADIGGSADAMHYVPLSKSGDATLVAQVLSETGNTSAEAGIDLRADTTAGAVSASVLRTTGNGVRFEYRTATGGDTAWAAVPTPLSNIWVKLTRLGNAVAGYYSTDGATWTQIGSTQTLPIPTAALWGLAVNSHDTTSLSTATFGSVAINPNTAPTLAAAASASSTSINGASVNLSVLGADNAGESSLNYTWTLLGNAPDAVSFSTNGTNASKNTTATFACAGTYTFRVLVSDTVGGVTSSDVTVTVNHSFTSISVTPATITLYNGETQYFTAAALDQFGMPFNPPAGVVFSIDAGGVGTVDPVTGLYTAPASGGGTVSVRATCGALSGAATVTVNAITSVGSFSNSLAIGSPALSGAASFNGATYTVSSGGSDIWGASDQFRFVYQKLTGDGTITARVVSMGNTNAFAKAGVMFRTSLAANSAYAINYVLPTGGTRFEYRNSAGANSAGAGSGLSSGSPPTYIRLTRVGNTISAAYSTDGTNWTTQTTTLSTIAGTTPGSTLYVGLVVCSHNTAALNTATFDNVSVVQPTAILPYSLPLNSADGLSSVSGTTVTLSSSGNDIWGTADSIQYTYLPITGNGSITARVASISGLSTNAKIGVMIRASLSAGAPQMSALINPNGNIRYAWRASQNGNTSETNIGIFTVPYWLRVTRTGNSLSAYYSANGTNWTQIGVTRTITMGSTAFIGLTAAALGSSTTASFDNVSTTGTTDAAPTVSAAASASASPVTGTTTTLSVLGADPDAAESNLTYTWSTVGFLPGNVTFSANGTNAAKSTIATFTNAGVYHFSVLITDGGGLTTSSFVTVTVNPTFTSIAVVSAASAIASGATRPFSAVALDQFGIPMASQPAFTWSVTGGGSINSASGLYTAPAASASAMVSATSGAISGTAAVTVTNQSPLVAGSIGATASPSVVIGTTTSLSVSAVDDGGPSNLIYTWAVIGGPPAPVTFSVNNTNTAASTMATFSQAGSYSFLVTITDSAGLSTTSSVNVTVISTLSTITVSPASTVLNETGSQQFSAAGFDQFGNALAAQPAFTWAIASGIGSINTSGLYTAPASAGSATITASSGAVTSPPVSVTVNNAPPTVASAAAASPNSVGDTTTTLTALGADDAGESNLTYTWATTGNAPGAVTFSSANGTNAGKSTTAAFTQAGSYTFQVTITDSAGLSVTSSVAVTVNQTLSSIVVSPGVTMLNENGTQQFAATALDQFGLAMASQPTFTWTVASGIGSVDGSGLYTAPSSAGSAVITAGSGSVTSAAVNVTINNATPTVATAAAASPATVIGITTDLSVLGADDGGEANLTYTWSATTKPAGSNPAYSANGTNGAKNSTVTFDKYGSYTFTVTISDGTNSTTSQVNVTVNQTLTTITTSPNSATLNENATQQFSATAYDQFGAAMASQPSFTWTKTAGIGSIDSAGLYTSPGSSGTATIKAASGTTSSTANITINNATPTVATAAAASPATVTGTTTDLFVLGADDGGESNLTYTWAATTKPAGSNPAYSANGANGSKNSTVRFNKYGSYTFTVTISDGTNSTTSSVNVTVNQTLTAITVSPSSTTLNENSAQQFNATALDQFGAVMSSQPSFTWSKTAGVGSIDTAGLYTSPGSSGSATIQAASGAISSTASITINNATPTVATAAAASPATVTSTTTGLSVLGADDGGENNLTYTWAATTKPAGSNPAYSPNATNGAKDCTVTFDKYGSYTFKVTISDGTNSTTSSVNVTVNQAFTTITITPSSATVNENATQQFSATANDQFGAAMASQPSFTWSKTAGIGGIDSAGLYTSPGSSGTATIQAASGAINSTANITINNATPTVATAAAALPATVTGTTTDLSVLGADDGGESNLAYTWSATTKPAGSNPAYSANGTNGAKNSTVTFDKYGSYTFTVTISDGTNSTTSSVNVTVNQTLTSITVSPSSQSLNENATQQFSATAYDQFGLTMASQPSFTWTETAGIGSIDSAGLYSSPGSSGTATIKAASGAVSGTASITINNATPTVATAAAASPATVTGTTTALSVLGADDGGENNLTYTWATTGIPPAAVIFSANSTNNAKTTIATFTRAGTYNLQATITDAGGLSTTSSVVVTVNQTFTRIAVNPSSASVTSGGTQKFAATALDQFDQSLGTQPTFTWSLGSGSGSISSTGLYTASYASGSATVQASSGAISDTAAVTITDAAPTVASAAASSASPVAGKTTNLSVLGADSDGGGESHLTYTWMTTGSVPAPVSFTINASNAAKNTAATFTQAGTYNFQVTITDAGGLSTTSSVSVTVNQTLTSINVSPASATLASGGTQQFLATGYDQFGNAMSNPMIWSTTGANNAINSSGLFTAGTTPGTYTVTAASGTISSSAQVSVTLFSGSSDIGSVGFAGSSSLANGIYTVAGSGADIWSTADAFHYTYVRFTGDGQIVARVNSVQNTNAWAKAGVMFRNSLAANSQQAIAFVTPGNSVSFQYRATTGGSSAQSAAVTGLTAPYWVKLVRSGNNFLAFRSSDGATWSQVGSAITINMGSSIYVGLAVTAHNNAALCTATFSNVTLTPYTNLAINKSVAASSTASGSAAANAVDGNTSTAWTSAAAGTQSFTVDLGAMHSLSHLRLNWGANYATAYTLQVSTNNSMWTTVYSQLMGTGGVVDITGLSSSGRYVRLSLTSSKSTHYILNELSVFGV